MLQKTNFNKIIKEKYQSKLIKEPKLDYEKAFNALVNGTIGKFGKYIAVENALVYRTVITSDYGSNQTVGQEVIVRKIGDTLVGNSSILSLIGMSNSFGNIRHNKKVTDIQTMLSTKIPMIPYSVFDEANLNLGSMEIIERGNEETVTRKIENPKYRKYRAEEMIKKNIPEFLEEAVHFTGASLFKVDDKYFLFDIDREEIKHKIFNAFLVAIPTEVSSIKEAYEALKPNLVKELETKHKIERQGEWFFIPVKLSDKLLGSVEVFGDANNTELDTYSTKTFVLQAGKNRPNVAQMGFKHNDNAFVKGLVRHEGREHRDLTLKRWFMAIPNTATESFTIEGDID